MHEFKEEMKGTGEQLKGKIKEETGDLLDDSRMETEGNMEKNLGKARRDMAQPMEEIKGTGQEIKGKLKEETGDVLDDEVLESEGRDEKLSGRVRSDR